MRIHHTVGAVSQHDKEINKMMITVSIFNLFITSHMFNIDIYIIWCIEKRALFISYVTNVGLNRTL